jgi:DMSO reductase family type II enzyme heme b subunit
MKRRYLLLSGLAASAVLLGAVLLSSGALSTAGARAEDRAEERATPTPLPPAERLHIAVGDHPGSTANLLKDHPAAWASAPIARVLLNRTPRIFPTEPRAPAAPPILQVRGLRAQGKLYLRLEWPDATRDTPPAGRRQTAQTSSFSDAAAVMVPHQWKGPEFPSLQMGDKRASVRLYYWAAGAEAVEMTATGRTTTAATGNKVRHHAGHAGGKWVVVFELPDRPDGWPVAFAIWDGHNQDRDGRKVFSLWYVLKTVSNKSGPLAYRAFHEERNR